MMTKAEFEQMFRSEILPVVRATYEQDGRKDRPARAEAWNNTVDAYVRDRLLPRNAVNWAYPKWL